MTASRLRHLRNERGRASRRFEDLDVGRHQSIRRSPGHEHAPIFQQRRRMFGPRSEQRPGDGELIGRRVEAGNDIGRRTVGSGPAEHQRPPIAHINASAIAEGIVSRADANPCPNFLGRLGQEQSGTDRRESDEHTKPAETSREHADTLSPPRSRQRELPVCQEARPRMGKLNAAAQPSKNIRF